MDPITGFLALGALVWMVSGDDKKPQEAEEASRAQSQNSASDRKTVNDAIREANQNLQNSNV